MPAITDVSDQPGEAPATAAAPRSPARRPSAIAGLLLRLHFYAGILVAPFLVVAALTGLLYVFTPQLDNAVHGRELYVDRVGSAPRPLSEQLAAARAAHPTGTVASVQPGLGDTTTRVSFAVPELADDDKLHTVFVDPYTARVRGTLTTWWGSTPLTTWLDDLHRNLHLGAVGRYYSELAASWLWVVVLGGLILWARRVRGARRRARRFLLPDLAAAKGVRRTRGWHATMGVWMAVGLLFLSATGMTWSLHAGATFGSLLDALSARTPALATDLPAGGHHPGPAAGGGEVDPAALDRVAAVAAANGLDGPIEITPPASPAAAWSVSQVDNAWPVRLDRAAIDPAAGSVVSRSDFADWPLLAQATKLGIQGHMGILFGVVNQILLAALAIGLVCAIAWGYLMWWQRRPTRSDRRALVGTPPTRGAWQGLPDWLVVVGVLVVVGLCWALPVLGVTLVAFLLADLAAGALTARRARRAPAAE
ncbi:membrane protein [Pilimelia anulata]|uniref:Membrane protein n=1 Tax=Pilimelia anulata TaxID=53371 RepID=A0A8J3BE54_9ACTN|nr:PepSY-associated TM helix domain-containing protein [Pilimelia anulata]GGK08095.1 membrane protein [Pilimelia anulata]